MQKSAIDKARDRLITAKARLKELESSKGYETARRQWYDFLTCSNGVFSMLEQGAKGFPKSNKWFAEKKQERKADPLLRYLHHARNAEEHGISSVTALDRQKIVMVENGEPIAEIRDVVGDKGRFSPLSGSAPNLERINELRIYPDRPKLIPVKDRGTTYDPPTEHLKATIPDATAIAVAQLMVGYLEAMIVEAESFVIVQNPTPPP